MKTHEFQRDIYSSLFSNVDEDLAESLDIMKTRFVNNAVTKLFTITLENQLAMSAVQDPIDRNLAIEFYNSLPRPGGQAVPDFDSKIAGMMSSIGSAAGSKMSNIVASAKKNPAMQRLVVTALAGLVGTTKSTTNASTLVAMSDAIAKLTSAKMQNLPPEKVLGPAPEPKTSGKAVQPAAPKEGKVWYGGLSESMLNTLACIAEAGPDVYSIVKKAWSQGQDADTIKQILQSLQYPSGDVDNIISKLEAEKAAGQPSQAQPAPDKPASAAQPAKDKTIYVDRKGGASYADPAQSVPRVSTGDEYIDNLLNSRLASGGKEEALRSAINLLTRYETSRIRKKSTGNRETKPAADLGVLQTLRSVDRFLRSARVGK